MRTGTASMRVLPALEDADGLALVELDAAIAVARAHYTRRILLLEGFFDARRAARDRAAPARRCGAQRSAGADARARALARPLEVFVKVNTGMNRLGIAPTQRRGDLSSASTTAPSVAALRLMTHFARADEDDGIDEPLAAFNAACRGMPYPRSLANSAGVVRYGEIGGEIVRPGIMLYGATPFAYDSAAMHRRCGR